MREAGLVDTSSSYVTRRRPRIAWCAALIWCAALTAAVDAASSETPVVAGADRALLARTFAEPQIVIVNSLGDDGAIGTLRWAVETDETADGAPITDARVIAFAVSGDIALGAPLAIRRPATWIAGQTAPRRSDGSGGVTLLGQSLIVRAGRVVVEHLRIRPGPTTGDDGDEIDGVRVGASVRGDIADIVLRNLSISWSVDELLSVAPREGERIVGVSILSSLFTEPLTDGGHSKGAHNYGVFLRRGAQGVLLAGNAISGATRRLPTVEQSSSAAILNNLVSNWGAKPPLHALFRDDLKGRYADLDMRLTVRGNAATAGPQTPAKTAELFMTPFAKRPERFNGTSGLAIHMADNTVGGRAVASPRGQRWLRLLDSPPLTTPEWTAWPAIETRTRVLASAGAWPGARDETDTRIVAAIAAGRDDWTARPPPRRPDTPHSTMPTLPEDRSPGAVVSWLEVLHRSLGGMPGA